MFAPGGGMLCVSSGIASQTEQRLRRRLPALLRRLVAEVEICDLLHSQRSAWFACFGSMLFGCELARRCPVVT